MEGHTFDWVNEKVTYALNSMKTNGKSMLIKTFSIMSDVCKVGSLISSGAAASGLLVLAGTLIGFTPPGLFVICASIIGGYSYDVLYNKNDKFRGAIDDIGNSSFPNRPIEHIDWRKKKYHIPMLN